MCAFFVNGGGMKKGAQRRWGRYGRSSRANLSALRNSPRGRPNWARPRVSRVFLQHVRRRSCGNSARSEEHTSELQSRRDLVCRLLLEKKKQKKIIEADLKLTKNNHNNR